MARYRALLALILTMTFVAAACGDDEATTTTAPATTVAVTTTVAATTTVAVTETTVPVETFDLTAAVGAYVTTIPEGWMNVSDITAFKDALGAGAYLIDVREVTEYEAGHIAGSVNIPLRTLTDNLAMIPTDRQVFISCKSGLRAAMGVSSLRMLGYDNVLGFSPSYDGWVAAGEPVTTDAVTGETFTIPEIAPELFAAVDTWVNGIPDGFLQAGDVAAVKAAIEAGAFLVDVRETSEYAEGYIADAINIPLRTLTDNLALIPTDTQVIVYCKSGLRCSLAMPILGALGFDNVKVFVGSYNAWTAAGEPITLP